MSRASWKQAKVRVGTPAKGCVARPGTGGGSVDRGGVPQVGETPGVVGHGPFGGVKESEHPGRWLGFGLYVQWLLRPSLGGMRRRSAVVVACSAPCSELSTFTTISLPCQLGACLSPLIYKRGNEAEVSTQVRNASKGHPLLCPVSHELNPKAPLRCVLRAGITLAKG